MNPVLGSIAGREAELAVVRRFAGAHADGPASLTIAGETGIGKTAIGAQALRKLRWRESRSGPADAANRMRPCPSQVSVISSMG
jgi:DNA-binding NtrC family response regulator